MPPPFLRHSDQFARFGRSHCNDWKRTEGTNEGNGSDKSEAERTGLWKGSNPFTSLLPSTEGSGLGRIWLQDSYSFHNNTVITEYESLYGEGMGWQALYFSVSNGEGLVNPSHPFSPLPSGPRGLDRTEWEWCEGARYARYGLVSLCSPRIRDVARSFRDTDRSVREMRDGTENRGTDRSDEEQDGVKRAKRGRSDHFHLTVSPLLVWSAHLRFALVSQW